MRSVEADSSISPDREISRAYAVVRDLMRPRASCYWIELCVSGSAAWLALLAAFASPVESPLMWAAVIAATFLFFRVSIFVHELTHRRRAEIPGFHPAWNLFVGVPLFLPSILYEGIHKDHHSKSTYGTANDPEYLPFASQPMLILGLLQLSFTGPILLIMRFLVLAPVSWFVPPFRRWLETHLSIFGFNPGYRRVMTPEQRRCMRNWEIIILCIWWPALTMTALGLLPLRWLPIWFGMYVAIATINHVRELIAHRYESDGRPLAFRDQLADSINTPGHWWTALWAPLGLRFHALHHLFPRLPYHNLAQAHRRLTQALPEHATYHAAHNGSLAGGLLRLIHRPRQKCNALAPLPEQAAIGPAHFDYNAGSDTRGNDHDRRQVNSADYG